MVSSRSDIGTTALTLNVGGQLVDLSQPAVMGILNVTPDSFYAGSRVGHLDEVVRRAGEMLEHGATFLDVGGYSTRPGAEAISPEEELGRVVPAIEAVRKAFPAALVSVDTFRAAVARAAVATGAGMVNDISGGTLDADMFRTVAALQIPYVLMHLRGTPQTMTSYTQYEDLPREVFGYFVQKVFALRQLGVKDIVLDLGFGFAKTPDQNFQLLRHWNYFKPLGLPVLAGLSRKSMIYKKLGIPVAEALNGTTVLNTIALTRGASILRVHDVKEAVQAVKLYQLYRGF
jgi:dihydropteroate synthase